MHKPFHIDSTGGGIHETAIIGHPPELRDWRPGHKTYVPSIASSARIHAYVTVDAGAHRSTVIGARAWLMKHAHVGHDCLIRPDVEIAPHAVIGGGCVIESGAHIGMGAVVKPGTWIGEGAKVGCGAVVIQDVPAGETWAGNPARNLRPEPVSGPCRDCGRFSGKCDRHYQEDLNRRPRTMGEAAQKIT